MHIAKCEIRPMTCADIRRVSDILCEGYRFCAGPDNYSSSQLEALLRDIGSVTAVENSFKRHVGQWFVACRNEAAGFIHLEKNEIVQLYVAVEFHRRGIASALFYRAQKIIGRSYPNMFLTTTGYGAPFYVSMGMKKTGVIVCDSGPLAGNILMKFEKELI